MGFQFQAVASVSSFLVEDLAIDYARLGTLIGLYHLPGIALAFPGGLLGKRFGDKRVVAAGLGLMAFGGLLMGVSDSYALAAPARLLSGVGAVLLSVLLTKMVADWFAGREIVTAMAVLMSSWPLGISLALVSLGPLAAASSWQLVMHLTAVACLVALFLVVALYRPPSVVGNDQATGPAEVNLSRHEVRLVLLASLVWTLFNVGFLILPSFAPEFLTSMGYTMTEAGSIQLGGYLAERLGQPNLTMVACFFGIGLAICLLPCGSHPLASLLALGLLFGPPVGIIMALPAKVLRPENRAPGMGVFYTCTYAGMAALPPLAGLSRDLTGSPAAPLLFGGTLLFIAIIILGLFRTFQRRSTNMAS
jgi:predicted MFS family arabinose efflux permease